MSLSGRSLGRRRFLAIGLGGSAATLLVPTGAAVASADEVGQVWRLSAHWGYSVPPKGRTRCRCNACRAHAANKLYATRGAATAGRIHPCCVCQPFSVDVSATGFAALFAAGITAIDLRTPGVRATFEAAVAVSPPTPTPTTTTSTTVPVVAGSPQPASRSADVAQSPAVPDPTLPAARSLAGAAQLPTTGQDATLPLIAAGVVVAGAAALLLAHDRPAAESGGGRSTPHRGDQAT